MPRVVYVCWPPREISGGIKAAFQHVELLAAGGMDAVVATENAERPGWFESVAKVVALDAVRTDDVVVLPENHHGYLSAFAALAQRKFVFCQNPHQVHRGLAGRASYAEFGVSRIMCASHTLMHFCALRFPGMKLAYTPYFIEDYWLEPAPAKTLQVAVIPRKRPIELGAMIDLLGAWHPDVAGVPWAIIQEATERQVCETMGRSAVFLSMARLEAHSMTQLEAMARGCIVAGFQGVYGGNDSSTARNGFWAAEDDLHGCVHQLAAAIRLARARGPQYDAMVADGRRTAAQYRREEVSKLLLGFFEEALR